MKFWDYAKKAGAYVAARFSKKEASTWIGVALLVASGGGYLTVQQVAMIKAIAALFGIEVDAAAEILTQLSAAFGAGGAGAVLYKPGSIPAIKSVALSAIGVGLVAAFAVPAPATAGEVGVRYEWDRPATRVDGSDLPEAEITGYVIEYKTPSSDWVSVPVNDGAALSFDQGIYIPNPKGSAIESKIVSRMYTVAGDLTSPPSEEFETAVRVPPDVYPPAPPGNVRAVVRVSVVVDFGGE